MGIILKPIDVVDDISKEEFYEKYLKPRRPVVIKNMAKKWPAYQKWTMEYMKEVVGDVEVPLYDSSKADPSAPINSSAAKMKFGDYIDLIQREPTDLRIFLFDPIKYAPNLLEDYISPKELMGGFLDKYPNMFFGGKGSETFNEAKTRLTVIQANKKEFEYQVLHGEFIKITTVVNLVVDYIHRNKAKTRSIPDKWTHSFVGLEDELEIRKTLTDISNELLQEQSTERFSNDLYEKLDQQVKSSNGLLATSTDDDSQPVGRSGKNDSTGSRRRTRKVANRKG